VAPFLVVVPVVYLVWHARPGEDNRAALLCEAVAAELRAGASIRHALDSAVVSVGGSPLPPDVAIAEVASLVAEEFPSIRRELELTITKSARSGSDVAAIFDEIAALSVAQSEIKREVRTATAPGRATALVLTGAPALYVTTRMASGGIGRFLASSQQRFMALLGLGLFIAGLGIALVVVWRAGR
jgi:hypothetical protein